MNGEIDKSYGESDRIIHKLSQKTTRFICFSDTVSYINPSPAEPGYALTLQTV